MKNSLKSNFKNLARIALATCCLTVTSYAANEGAFGLSEENAATARKTLMSIRPALDEAVRRVEQVYYPNIATYGIDTSVAKATSKVVSNLIGTGGTLITGYTKNDISTKFTTYTSHPYISKLAIVESGLRVQLQFVGSTSAITSGTSASTSQVPLFEPFYNTKIVLLPVFNIEYTGTTTKSISAKDQGIMTWECLTNADNLVTSTGIGLSEGMRSVVSMAGGILGSCQYISDTSMDAIWVSLT